MSNRKTAITRQLKHRLDADLYLAVAERAEAEHRSLSNLVTVALLAYLDDELPSGFFERLGDWGTPGAFQIVKPSKDGA